MKKSIIIAVIIIAASCKLPAQTSAEATSNVSKKLVASMEANLKLLDTASAPATFIMLANNFERIGVGAYISIGVDTRKTVLD